MSVWDWVREFVEDAAAEGDERRMRLVAHYQSAQDLKDTPDAALAELERGRRLAVELGEPWWVLFFEHWKLQCLLNHAQDTTRAMPLAVAATVEARKPAYDGCPQRLCVHDDLITAYLSLDGPGYAKEIAESLAYMEAEVSERAECRFCILQNRAELAEYQGDEPVLRASAERLVGVAQEEGDAFNEVYCQAWLCLLAWRAKDMTALAMHAAQGAALCEETDLPGHEAEFLVWRACLARLDKQEREAAYHLRQAEAILARTQRPPGSRYFDARCAFHAMAGEREQELAAREREIATLQGKSKHFREARARVEQCRLLKELGRPTAGAAGPARQAVARLRQPGEMAARLAALDGSV